MRGGGQVVRWFIMSCYQRVKLSQETYTRSNWNMCNRHCARRYKHWLIEKVFFSSMITPDRLSRELSGIPHTATCVRDFVPPPDLAPTDYYLFHPLDNHLRGKSFTNETDLRQFLTNFFASKTPSSTARGLNSWRHVGRRCSMPMAITLKAKYKLHIP